MFLDTLDTLDTLPLTIRFTVVACEIEMTDTRVPSNPGDTRATIETRVTGACVHTDDLVQVLL